MTKGMRGAGFAAQLACLLFAALRGEAATKETSGYGTGDGRAQAFVDAKSDAILNFGGKVSFERSEQGSELVRDEEKSENHAFLISYEVTDEGESIEGSYARVRARVSDSAEYVLKDGKTDIRGGGTGRTAEEAAVMALCDAVLESGARVDVAIRNENAQLAEQRTRMDAVGAVASYVLETGMNAEGRPTAAATCRIFPGAKSLSALFPKEVESTGRGENAFAAAQDARRAMLLKSSSEFHVHALYEYGVLKSMIADRKCDVFLTVSGFERDAAAGGGGVKVRARGILCAGPEQTVPHAKVKVKGLGIGKDFTSARKAALCDALVNRGSHAVLNIRYDMGRRIKESAQFRSSLNYFGEEIMSQSKTRDGYVVTMTVSAGGELPELDESLSQSVEAVGYAKDRWYLPAFIETFLAKMDARQGAVDMVFGCPVDVSVSERNGAVNNSSCSYKHSLGSMIIKYYTQMGYVGESQVVSQKSDNGAVAVKVAAVVKKHSMSLLATIVYALVAMVVGFTVIKKKLPYGNFLLAAAWIFTALGFFAFEHWVLGIVAIVFGIYCHFMEADY